ncbi:hypothetical protein [Jatrophihabitans fulvus]
MRLTRPRLRRPGDGRGRVAFTVLALLALVACLGALVLYAVTWRAQYLLAAAAVSHQLMWAAPVAMVLALLVRRWTLAGVAAVVTGVVALVQCPRRSPARPRTGGRSPCCRPT